MLGLGLRSCECDRQAGEVNYKLYYRSEGVNS